MTKMCFPLCNILVEFEQKIEKVKEQISGLKRHFWSFQTILLLRSFVKMCICQRQNSRPNIIAFSNILNLIF